MENSVYIYDWGSIPLELIRKIFDCEVDNENSPNVLIYPSPSVGRLVCRRFNHALVRKKLFLMELRGEQTEIILNNSSFAFLRHLKITKSGLDNCNEFSINLLKIINVIWVLVFFFFVCVKKK